MLSSQWCQVRILLFRASGQDQRGSVDGMAHWTLRVCELRTSRTQGTRKAFQGALEWRCGPGTGPRTCTGPALLVHTHCTLSDNAAKLGATGREGQLVLRAIRGVQHAGLHTSPVRACLPIIMVILRPVPSPLIYENGTLQLGPCDPKLIKMKSPFSNSKMGSNTHTLYRRIGPAVINTHILYNYIFKERIYIKNVLDNNTIYSFTISIMLGD